jgi:hypothetical protein
MSMGKQREVSGDYESRSEENRGDRHHVHCSEAKIDKMRSIIVVMLLLEVSRGKQNRGEQTDASTEIWA